MTHPSPPDRPSERQPVANRRTRLTPVRRGCGCRRPSAGRPRCMRLHIPRVHLVV